MIHLYSNHPQLNEIIDIISFILKSYKIEHDIDHNLKIINENDIWIGIWNFIENPPKNFILINVESLTKHGWTNIIQKYKKALHIIDYSGSNIKIYKKLEIFNCSQLSFGYCELHEIIYNKYANPNNEKNIDILFYGYVTPRRSIILEKLKKFYEMNNISYFFSNSLYDYKSRYEMISRSKIVLSIAHDEPSMLKTNDLIRIGPLLSNKIFILAEKMQDSTENELKNIIKFFSTFDELTEKCLYYLKNEKERILIAENAYNYCKKNINVINFFPVNIIKNISKKLIPIS